MLLYPVVPVRDMVIYPGVVSPVFVTRPQSMRALEEANSRGRLVFVTAQKNNFIDGVSQEDLFKVGTLCKILQNVRLPDGTVKVVLEGGWRCKALHYISGENFLEAELEKIRSITSSNVNRMFLYWKEAAGVQRRGTAHTFSRHSPASLLVKNGCDLRSIQSIMHHRDINTTLRYTHLSDSTKREKQLRYLTL